MWTRLLFAAVIVLGVTASVAAQTNPPAASEDSPGSWRSAGENAATGQPAVARTAPAGSAAAAPGPSAAVGSAPSIPYPSSAPATGASPGAGENAARPATASSAASGPAADVALRRAVARVSTGSGSLSNEHGQLYREYDISPYTLRVTSTSRPEQAIVDWILRETGYEAWHSEPLAILSATPRKLRVATVDSPSWRVRVQRLLLPVQVQTPGVQAWLLEKEGAAMLVADLRRRSDYREHSSPYLLVNNGQSAAVSATRGRNYIRNVRLRPEAWPGFEPQGAVMDEGFTLEFSPLLSVDGRLIDAAIKCEINQVEKLIPVMLDVPTTAAPRQRTKMEVPQIAHFRFHERFRWPVEQVLLIATGVVASPVPSDAKPLVPGVSLPLGNSPARAELLVFVESKGKLGQAPRGPAGGTEASLPRARQ
jgi:hypothetical protein